MDTLKIQFSITCKVFSQLLGHFCDRFFLSDAVRYTFGPLIQNQLTDLVTEWNHRIRKTATAVAPGGIPEVLYHVPPSGKPTEG